MRVKGRETEREGKRNGKKENNGRKGKKDQEQGQNKEIPL